MGFLLLETSRTEVAHGEANLCVHRGEHLSIPWFWVRELVHCSLGSALTGGPGTCIHEQCSCYEPKV